MSSLINDAFRHLKSSSGVKNAIGRIFLYNSSRFSNIMDEEEYEKNLLIIERFCPPEVKKYFRRLRVDKINDTVLNCFQLVNLHLDKISQDETAQLPRTLEHLKISNANDVRTIENFPRKLISLVLTNFGGIMDMKYLPKLEKLELRGRSQNNPVFMNSENHLLRSLTIFSTVVLNCQFPRIFYFNTNAHMNIYGLNPLSRETIADMTIPGNVDFSDPIFLEFAILRRLKLSYFEFKTPGINFHELFPDLRVFEIDVGHSLFPVPISFKWKMDKISCIIESLDDRVEADYFYLLFNSQYNEKVKTCKIPNNILKSKGEILIHNFYELSKLKFDSGKIESFSHPREYAVKLENNILHCKDI